MKNKIFWGPRVLGDPAFKMKTEFLKKNEVQSKNEKWSVSTIRHRTLKQVD